jgi:organic hydroperoxide reductase OsmC/OhrA
VEAKMSGRTHHYAVRLEWTGNLGSGTSGYRDYGRGHETKVPGKPILPGSSDPSFRGDRTRWNPEELLVSSLSSCHMLWYLHLCAVNGIVVTAYSDEAEGTMLENEDGSGRFASVLLRPRVSLAPGSNPDLASALHHEAHAKCFIANSVNFPVLCEPA